MFEVKNFHCTFLCNEELTDKAPVVPAIAWVGVDTMQYNGWAEHFRIKLGLWGLSDLATVPSSSSRRLSILQKRGGKFATNSVVKPYTI